MSKFFEPEITPHCSAYRGKSMINWGRGGLKMSVESCFLNTLKEGQLKFQGEKFETPC